MAARSRPRGGQLKDEFDEERSLWNQIRADARRIDQLMVSFIVSQYQRLSYKHFFLGLESIHTALTLYGESMAPRDLTKELAAVPGYEGGALGYNSRDHRRTQTTNTDIATAAPKKVALWVNIRQQAKNIDILVVGQ